MSDEIINNKSLNNDKSIDLFNFFEVMKILWNNKWIYLLSVLTILTCVVFYSYRIPSEYVAEAVLMPAENSSNTLADSPLSGLAGLSGINLNNGPKINKTTLALELIKSRLFIVGLINKYEFSRIILFAKEWDAENKNYIYSENVDLGIKRDEILYRKFLNKIKINQNNKTGIIKISYQSVSPDFSKKIVDLLIKEINNYLKKYEIEECEKSIKYIKSQMEDSNLSETKNIYFNIIESHTKRIVIAKINQEYALKTIDPAVIPSEKSYPKRKVMIIVAFFIANILSFIVVYLVILLKFFRDKNEYKNS